MMRSGWTGILLIVVLLVLYGGGFTALANLRKIPWNLFWGGSVALMAPWLLATLVVGIASIFVPPRLQTAAGMAGMFPALVFVGMILLAPMISLFAPAEAELGQRIRWFGGFSAVPASLINGFLIYIMIVDSLKDGSGGV